MQTESFYMQKGKTSVHIGTLTEGYAFLFKGKEKDGIVDLRSWHAWLKTLESQGYVLHNTWTDDTLTIKELLVKILGACKGKNHAIAKTADGWFDRNGNSFATGVFK